MTELNLTTEGGVVALMKGATSEDDWNSRCDQVKAANGGYPGFWFSAIQVSGLAARVMARW